MTDQEQLEEHLRRLHLSSMRACYEEIEMEARRERWSYREYLERLAAEEIAHRQERRLAQNVRRAGFPFLKTLEEFDFTFQTSVSRVMLGPYLGRDLVTGGRNLLLYGPSGVGKTALAIALAYKALQQGASVRFVSCTELIGELVQARARNEWEATLARALKPEVLVVDEVGYLSYGPYAANVLFPVVDKRYLLGNRPMLLTTNKDPAHWGTVLHDADLAQAILDRLLHHGEIVKMGGSSYRRHRPGQEPPPASDAGRGAAVPGNGIRAAAPSGALPEEGAGRPERAGTGIPEALESGGNRGKGGEEETANKLTLVQQI
jgi:DNA replication protein DnaC